VALSRYRGFMNFEVNERDISGPSTHDTLSRPFEPKHASKGSMKASSSDQCALWRKRTEELEQQLSDNKKTVGSIPLDNTFTISLLS
jgi:hypothetical protein